MNTIFISDSLSLTSANYIINNELLPSLIVTYIWLKDHL